MELEDRYRGMILGTAVADALGVPFEGAPRRVVLRWRPRPWAHRFLLTKGMISDDTDHTVFVCQSLIKHPVDDAAFQRRLAWSFRWWFLSLPAGIGRATFKSIRRLWFGVHPSKSGVFSAGNGPAMRAAPFGAFFNQDKDSRERFLTLATLMTHTDPKALIASRAVADLAAEIVNGGFDEVIDPSAFIALLKTAGPDEPEWCDVVRKMAEALDQDLSVAEFAATIGCAEDVTPYVYHTVPVATYAWFLHFGDFETAVSAALDCGGDTDTVAAITGALAGLSVGEAGIPKHWVQGIWDTPRNVPVMRRIAQRLAQVQESQKPQSPVFYVALLGVPRNGVFLVLDLIHVLVNFVRRLFS